MEVLAVQQQFQTQYGVLGSNKIKDWTSTLTPPSSSQVANLTSSTTRALPLPYLQNNTTNKMKNSITKKSTKRVVVEFNNSNNNGSNSNSSNNHNNNHHNIHNNNNNNNNNSSSSNNNNNQKLLIARAAAAAKKSAAMRSTTPTTAIPTPALTRAMIETTETMPPFAYERSSCADDETNDIMMAENELSLRLLKELRAAKSRHLTCTEVSLPCDLTARIAAEIIRVSEKEPCGIRGCTIYIEFEDEPNNSRRIATLQIDPETVSTFEIYLTLRQDHRGWAALLPQFMKSLARVTITISPEFTITKHKLYSPQHSNYSYACTTSNNSVTALS